MSIRIRFFASLADRVGIREIAVDGDDVKTAEDAWKACVDGIEIPGNARVAINQQYADFADPVKQGDEVAFFPPVTGG